MSIRNLPGVIGRPAREAGNVDAISEPIVKVMWDPTQPYRPSRPVTGIALLFLLYFYFIPDSPASNVS
jgi:hypothetical protein